MLSLVFLIASQTVGFQNEGRPWQVVTSQEGQFTVEMPSQPNFSRTRTRTGPGGRVKVVLTGCRTPGGVYQALKIEFPTAVARGAEKSMLDAERNNFAQEFHGKVVTEKEVRLGTQPGRDFTIRGQEPGAGVIMVRAREFLAGKAIYALVVSSAPNRELPEDAGRFLGSLNLGTAKAGVAEPSLALLPEPTGKPLEGWGMAIDPDGDCKIQAKSKVLSIVVPGKLHDLNADIRKLNAPRVVKEVDGDFSAEVKVVGDFTPGGKALNPKSLPYNGGGIVLWRDGDNFIRLERGAVLRQGKVGTFAIYEEREGGHRGAVHNGSLRPGTAWLRLERKGNRILGSVSNNGRDWAQLKPIDTLWPGQLEVGLVAVNSNSEPLTIRFEDYKVQTP